MDLRHLHIFLVVVSCDCNLTRAAQSLYITQPAVSIAIRELEEHYGVALFARFSRKLYLTEAGKAMLNYARRITSLFSDLDAVMGEWKDRGEIFVGASLTVGSYFISDYVRRWKEVYPWLKIHVCVEPSRYLEEKLLHNELDLALVETAEHAPELHSVWFRRGELRFLSSSDSPVARRVLTMEEFAGLPVLLREKGSGTREVFEQEMKKKAMTISPLWECQSTEALLHAVSQNLGVTILPEPAVEDAVSRGGFAGFEIEDCRFCQDFYILYHRDKLLNTVIQNMISMLSAFNEDQVPESPSH